MMRFSLRRPALLLALALAACAKQQPLPVASFSGTAGLGTDNSLTVATGQQVILDGSSSNDPAGGAITYQWSFVQTPRGSQAKFDSPKTAKTRFTPDVPTTTQEKYVLSLVVSTKYFDSVPQFLTINALECGANVPVIASVTASPNSINVSTAVLLTASVDDKDNDAECLPNLGNVPQPLTYRWNLTGLPAGSRAHVRDPHAVLAAFDPDVPGTYTATLVVTDSTGRASDPFNLNVIVAATGGAVPAFCGLQSQPASPNLFQPTQLTANTSDADIDSACLVHPGVSLAWSIVGLPTGSSTQLNDKTALNPSFVPDVPGVYRFAVVATGPNGRSSAPQFFDVTAKDCGGAPPNPSVQFIPASAGVGTPVSLQVTPQDDDAACGVNETFSYSWSLLTVPGGSNAQIVASGASTASLVPDVGGDYAIAITITDSSGTSATAVDHLTVAGCGHNAPSVDSLLGLPLSPLAGQDVKITALVSDGDSSCAGYNPAQTYRWSLVQRPPGSAAAIVDPTAKSADFVPDVMGTYQAQLIVTDATGLASAPALFQVTTSTCGHSAPQVVAVGASNSTPDPGSTISLFAQTSDPDNGGSCNLGQGVSLLWSVASRPAGSSATLSNPATARPTFTPDVAGSYQFSVVATDSTGLRSSPAFDTIATTTCGTATPSVSVQPASVSVQPFQVVPLSATPFDSDSSCGINETFSYAWQVVSAPAASAAAFSDPAAAAPAFIPDVAGSYLLSVTVSDGRGHTSPPAFVAVTASGCATLSPVTGALTASAASLGNPVTLTAAAARAQACGLIAPVLTYAWSLSGKPAGSAAQLDDPAAAAPHFTPDVAGLYQATLVVTDVRGQQSAPGFVNVSVASCGTSLLAWSPAPELTPSFQEPDGSSLTATLSGGSWTGANAGTRVTMAAGFVDPPGCGTLQTQPYTYQWALVLRPNGSSAQLSNSDGEMPSFVPDLPGDYQIAARVGDATGAVLPTRFTTVHASTCGFNAPVVAIAPPATTAPNTFQALALDVLGGSASDADGTASNPGACPARFQVSDTFSYAWSVSPAGPSLLPMTGASTTFTAATPGAYTVSLVATASNGLSSAPATQLLDVGTCGSHPPSIASVTTSPASRPAVGQSVTITAVATDGDLSCGDSIDAYSWTLASAPAGSSASAPAAGAAFSFTPDRAGAYSFTVVATDHFGLRSMPYTVTVQTATCAPALSAGASDLTPAVGEQVTFTASASGDSCVAAPVFNYAWRIVSAPHGSAAALSAVGGAAVKFTPDVSGLYSFSAVATDQGGFSSDAAAVQISAGTCGANPPTLGVISAAPSTPDAGSVVTLSSALTDHNAACGALTQPYHWSWTLLSRPSGSGATLASTDATPSFVPDVPGAYQISAQVTDALGNVSAAVFKTLSTSSCGLNPVTASILPAGSPQLNATAGVPLALTAQVSDADNSCSGNQFHVTLSQQWSILTQPAGAHASLTSATAGATSFSGDVAGTYVVGLRGSASNGKVSDLATASILVGICGANPPAVVSVNASASRPAAGAPVTLTANVFDQDNAGSPGCAPQGQTFTYVWHAVSTPPGATVNTSSTTAALSFTPAVAGSYVFDVTATDSAGLSSAPFRTTVSTGTCGPSLGTLNTSGTLLVGSPVSVSLASATDSCVAGNPGLTYFWSLASRPPTSSTAFAAPSAASNSFVPDVTGAYDVRVTVTDLGGFSSSADAVVSVGGCAAPPLVSINAPRSFDPIAGEVTPNIDNGDTVALSATVTGGGCGAAAPSYTYSWSIAGGPAGSSAHFDQPASSNPGFVADQANGTWQIQLVVKDQLGNAATQFAAVSSSSCGAIKPQPTVNASPANPNTFATSTLTVTNAATDPEAACHARSSRFTALPLSFAWSVATAPAGAPAPTLTASGASAQLTPKLPGAYQVQVVATGADGVASAPVLTTVTAQTCGYNAPSIGALTAVQAGGPAAPGPFFQRLDLSLSAGVSDPDNTTCGVSPAQTVAQHWTFTAVPAGSTAQLTAPDSANPHFVPDHAGIYTVQLTATDNFGLSTQQSFGISVGGCGGNAPSVAAPLSATQILSQTISLNTLSDPTLAVGFPVVVDLPQIQDNDTLCTPVQSPTYTYAWAMIPAAGSAARLSNASAAQPSFVPDVLGTYTLVLTVTDPSGLSGTASLAVNVQCGAGGPVAGALTATQVLPSLNTSAGPAANFTIVRTSSGAGQQNANVAFYPGEPVSLSAPFTDADTSCSFPESVTYSWSLAAQPAGSIAFVNQPASQTPSFVPDLPGEYDVQLTLTDSTGKSSTQTYSALIIAGFCGVQTPQASVGFSQPIAAAGPQSTISLPLGSLVVLDATGSQDADNAQLQLTNANVPAGNAGAVAGCGLSQTLSYRWTVTAAPGALQPLPVANADKVNPSFTAPLAGNYDLQLAVSDGSRTGTAQVSVHARGVGSGTLTATPRTTAFFEVGSANGANLAVKILDTDGNPLADAPVTLALASGFSGTNTFSATSGLTDINGSFNSAYFTTTKAALDTKGGEIKTVALSSGSTQLATTDLKFEPGPVTNVFWFPQPTDVAVLNGTITPSPEVDGEDAFGNDVTTYTSTVTLTLAQSPTNSNLTSTSNTFSQPAGTPFTDLGVDKTGTYQLLATVPENLPGPTPATTGPSPSFGVLSNTFLGTKAPPAAPVLNTSTAASPQLITLNWTGSQAGTKSDKTVVQYHLFRATGAITPPSALFADVGIATVAANCGSKNDAFSPCSFTDTSGLSDGTVYTYYLEADNAGVTTCNASTCSGASNTTQQYTVPGQAGAVATDGSTAQKTIVVRWNAPAIGTVTNYSLLRSTSPTSGFTAVAQGLTTTTATDTTPNGSENSIFYYEVQTNISGTTSAGQPQSDPGSNVTSSVSGLTKPAASSTPTGAASNDHSISLTWNAATGTNPTFTYTLFRGDPTSSYNTSFPGLTTNSYVDNSVLPGVQYHYAVQAVNASGTGGLSGDKSITTPAAAWALSNSGLTGAGWVNGFVSDPVSGTLYAATGNVSVAGPDDTTGGGVFKLSGATWSASGNGLPNGVVITSIAADAFLTTLYAGTSGAGVYFSIDGALTWNPVSATGLSNANIRTVFVDSQSTLWAGGDSPGGGIFSLPQAATTWTAASFGSPTTQPVLAFAEDLQSTTVPLYAQLAGGAAAGGGLWELSTTSATWSADTNQPALAGPVDCSGTRANESALAVDSVPSSGSVIYWGSQSCGLLSKTVASGGWATVASYAVPEITRLVRIDNGAPAAPNPQLWVASAVNTGASATSNGVTYINGATQTPLQNATFAQPPYWEPTALALDASNSQILYAGAGDGSGVYRSSKDTTSSAGGAFAKLNTGLANLRTRFVEHFDSSHLIAANDQTGVATSSTTGATWTPQTLTGCTTVNALAVNGALAFAFCNGVQGIFVGSTQGTSWVAKTCANLPASPSFSAGTVVIAGALLGATSPDKLFFAIKGSPATLWMTDAATNNGGSPGTTCTAVTPALPSGITDVSAMGADTLGDLFVGSPSNFVYTLANQNGASWQQATTGAKNVVGFFFNTTTAFAGGQDDVSHSGVGGAWSGPITGVGKNATLTWTSLAGSSGGVTGASAITAFGGVGGATPTLYAATSLTTGQSYANIFKLSNLAASSWNSANDGAIGGNVLSFDIIDANHLFAGTSASGILKTSSGGQ